MQGRHFAAIVALVFGMAGVLPLSAQAADAPLDRATFAKQRTRIETALASGVRYAEIAPDARRDVLDALARIGTTLGGVGSVQELTPEQLQIVQADQTLINERLAAAERDSRLRCETRSSIGSNIRGQSCETAAAKRKRLAEERELGLNRVDMIGR